MKATKVVRSDGYTSSHDKTGFCLRGVQTYFEPARVRIWVISTVIAPNKHISCKSCSSRTRPSVTATMIVKEGGVAITCTEQRALQNFRSKGHLSRHSAINTDKAQKQSRLQKQTFEKGWFSLKKKVSRVSFVL